jgi:acetyltransferase-like isoleucine patch superfamily enzyme
MIMMQHTPEDPDTTEDVKLTRASFRRYLAISNEPIPRAVRWLYRRVKAFALPAPFFVVKPMLWVYLTLRFVVHFVKRVFICQPLFKAYCKRCGKNMRTDIYIHWVQGKGDIILGDNVLVDGLCSFSFASRFVDRPVLEIGDGTGIGHNCSFTIGRRISIGRNCGITPGCWIMDSSGHPVGATERMADATTGTWKPPSDEDVREVVIGDNVWIGQRSIIFPGVTIGEGSIISAGSIVRLQIPPYSLVAGNPAKIICRLPGAPKVVDSSPQASAPGSR